MSSSKAFHVAIPLIRVAKGYSNGGIPRAVENRCRMLVDEGYRVTVIASFDDPNEPLPCQGVKHVHVPVQRRAPQVFPGLNDVLHGYALGSAFSKVHASDPFDIVDVQEPNLAPGIYPKAEKLGVAKVNSIHQSVLDGHRRFSRTRHEVLKYLNLYAARRADLNLAVSQFAKDGLVNHGISPDRVVVVYNPIPFPEPAQRPLRDAAMPLRVLWLGQMIPRKRLETAVDAARILADRKVNVEWLFAGDGPSRASAEAACAAIPGLRAEFLGHIKEPERINRLRAETDVSIVTSEHEISPLVVAEAMAAAIPTIYSDIAPHIELAGETGLCFALGDATGLAAKIEQLALDPELQLSLGTNAFERAKQMFDWAVIQHGLVDAYEMAVTIARPHELRSP